MSPRARRRLYVLKLRVILRRSDVMKERGLRSSCPFRARMLGVLTLSTTKEAAHAVWGPCAALGT